MNEQQKTYWPIEKLFHWSKNPRGISDEDKKRLQQQIDELGEYKPLLITQDGEVLGGNQRLDRYIEMGKQQIWVSIVEAKTDAEKLKFALSDNDRAGFYDEAELQKLIEELGVEINLDEYKVDLGEPITLAQLLENTKDNEVTEDTPPEVSKEPAVSQLGEVYQLGRHRLMCGDSVKIEDVEKLMDGQKADMIFTDPPYGVSYGDKNKFLNAIARGNHIQENIDNDTKPVVEMKKLWIDAFSNMNAVTKAGGVYYVCSPQGGELMMMMMSLLEAGWELKQSIIWVKNNHVLGRSDYHYKHEPILYGWKEGAGHQYYGGSGQTTAWFIDRPNMSELHPTMKPIQLVAKAINNSSKGDDIVLDLFLGSGSTLIASEQANRSCYGMELDPKYCDVIRKRFAKFIGQADNWEAVTPKI